MYYPLCPSVHPSTRLPARPSSILWLTPPFGITSRQNMQSLWLVAQRGADSKCPRQKLFHIPQQEGLTRSNLKQENGSSPAAVEVVAVS